MIPQIFQKTQTTRGKTIELNENNVAICHSNILCKYDFIFIYEKSIYH